MRDAAVSRQTISLHILQVMIKLKPRLFSPHSASPSSSRPRTPPFHGDNTGSNPVGDAMTPSCQELNSPIWYGHWKASRDERHAGYVLRRMEANIFPALGELPIDKIEAPQLVAMAKAIEKRGAHDVARRSLSTSGQIFHYAVAHGKCSRNPAADFRPVDVLKST